jgi:long-chain acyl-CoA synthetase
MIHRTTFSLLDEAAEQWGNLPALHQPKGGGRYETCTYAEFRRRSMEIACGLRTLGVGKGDIVAIHSETTADFFVVDFGVMGNGSVSAALYTSYRPEERAATLAKCAPKATFVENPDDLRALREGGAGKLNTRWILMSGRESGIATTDDIRQAGRDALKKDRYFFENLREDLEPPDLAILYLTSGATGEPKMGLVSHSAILANADMGPVVLKMDNNDRILDFLPSAHITQRVVGEFVPIRMGVQIWFSESLARLPGEMRKVRPTLFVAPPRLYERIHHSIAAEVHKKPALARGLYFMAVGLGADATRRRQAGEAIPAARKAMLALFRRLVYRKILDRLAAVFGWRHPAAPRSAKTWRSSTIPSACRWWRAMGSPRAGWPT